MALFRLYNQLEEVKQRKVTEERQQVYAQNREKRREFEQVGVFNAVVLNKMLHDLGPVAPISVNFNHQLAYFANQSDTSHMPHQPTAVA